MFRKTTLIGFFLAAFCASFLTGCEEKVIIPKQDYEKFFNRVVVTLRIPDGGTEIVFEANDPEGEDIQLAVTSVDQDNNELPIGFDFSLAVSEGPASSGTLRIILSHFNEWQKDGVNIGDESVFDIPFPVTFSTQ